MSDPQPRRALPAILLAVLITVSLAMRLLAARESLWVDELHTAWVVSGRLSEIPQRAQAGNQSPLYFYLAAAATGALGMSELALRVISILAGVALAPVSFLLVRRGSGSSAAAIAAAAIAAIDRDFLFYASEARVYAIVQLLGLFRAAAFASLLLGAAPKRRMSYVALSVLMFHLHYTTALLWLGEAACVAFFLRRARRREELEKNAEARAGRGVAEYGAGPFLLDSLLMLLLFLPAAPHVAEVYQRRENWASFVRAPALTQLASDAFAHRAAPLAWYFMPLVVCLAVGAMVRSSHQREPAADVVRLRRTTIALSLWITVPVLAAWLLTRTGVAHLFLYRYLAAPAAAAPLAAGLLCGLASTASWRRTAASGVVLGALIATVPSYVAEFSRSGRLTADRDEDWRSAVAYLNSRDDGLPLLLYAGLIESHDYADSPNPLLREYCRLPVRGVYQVNASRAVLPVASLNAKNLPPETCRALLDARAAVVLIRVRESESQGAVHKLIRLVSACGARAQVIDSQAFGGVTAAQIWLKQ
jgi:hypothetical protein